MVRIGTRPVSSFKPRQIIVQQPVFGSIGSGVQFSGNATSSGSSTLTHTAQAGEVVLLGVGLWGSTSTAPLVNTATYSSDSMTDTGFTITSINFKSQFFIYQVSASLAGLQTITLNWQVSSGNTVALMANSISYLGVRSTATNIAGSTGSGGSWNTGLLSSMKPATMVGVSFVFGVDNTAPFTMTPAQSSRYLVSPSSATAFGMSIVETRAQTALTGTFSPSPVAYTYEVAGLTSNQQIVE